MAAFVVVYDACVLAPFHLHDLLVRLAAWGLVQAKWTHEILHGKYSVIWGAL